jgi:hypothetical protein
MAAAHVMTGNKEELRVLIKRSAAEAMYVDTLYDTS